MSNKNSFNYFYIYIILFSFTFAEVSFIAEDIATSADGAYSVYAADMDGDGDMDIGSASYIDNTVAWYENDGSADPSSTQQHLPTMSDRKGQLA